MRYGRHVNKNYNKKVPFFVYFSYFVIQICFFFIVILFQMTDGIFISSLALTLTFITINKYLTSDYIIFKDIYLFYLLKNDMKTILIHNNKNYKDQ